VAYGELLHFLAIFLSFSPPCRDRAGIFREIATGIALNQWGGGRLDVACRGDVGFRDWRDYTVCPSRRI